MPITLASTSKTSMSTKSPSVSAPLHLVVLSNGLFGHSENWNGIVSAMNESQLDERLLVLVAKSNERLSTFQGMDSCGTRLAEEVRECVTRHSTLQSISFIGHSMGGLLCRYAIGCLFDESNKKICGLTPRHLITLATPHIGCDSEGEAELPFINWLRPLGLSPLIQNFPWASAAGLVLGRTGKHFFMEAESEGPPLLLRLCTDDRDRSQLFFSALASFSSRTAYSNVCDDHLVGWANASIRHHEDCPVIPNEVVQKGKGVVREDDVDAGLWKSGSPDFRLLNGRLVTEGMSRKEMKQVILQRLSMLPWRRIDVSFAGCIVRLSHNNIQMTRRWINFEGKPVADHLVGTLSHYLRLQESVAAAESDVFCQ